VTIAASFVWLELVYISVAHCICRYRLVLLVFCVRFKSMENLVGRATSFAIMYNTVYQPNTNQVFDVLPAIKLRIPCLVIGLLYG